MIYFTSDWHLGHKNVIEYCNRPFDGLSHMESVLFERIYNLPAGSTVIHCGDFAFRIGQDPVLPPNMTHVLVAGNHDGNRNRMKERYGFHLVVDELTMRLGKKRLVTVSHYPYRCVRYPDRAPIDRGGWLIHGHTHSPEPFDAGQRMIHVGVDAWDYNLVSAEQIIAIMQRHGS